MRPFARLLLALALLAPLPLAGQSYATSFADIQFDRGKPVATFHGKTEVEAASGRLSVRIPLEPGIGIGNLHFTPVLEGLFSPHMEVVGQYQHLPGTVYGWDRLVAPGRNQGMSVTTGYLSLALGDANEEAMYIEPGSDPSYYTETFKNISLQVSQFKLPNGEDGSLLGLYGYDEPARFYPLASTIPGVVQPTEVQVARLLQDFGYDGSWGLAAGPFTQNRSSSGGWTLDGYGNQPRFVTLGSGGELVLGLVRPAALAESVIWAPISRMAKGGPSGTAYCVPKVVVLLKDDVLYEFTLQTDINGLLKYGSYIGSSFKMSFLHSAPYACTAMLNRHGERISFGVDGTGAFTATLERGGFALGPKLMLSTAGLSVVTGGRTVQQYEFRPLVDSAHDQRGIFAGQEFPRTISGSFLALVHKPTGETIQFNYQSVSGVLPGPYTRESYDNMADKYQTLASITEPGKTTTFTWSCYEYLRTDAGLGLGGGLWSGMSVGNSPSCSTAARSQGWFINQCFAWGVTYIRETDTNVSSNFDPSPKGIRITRHDRVVPQVNHQSWTQWLNTEFKTTITHPGGRKTVVYFVNPLIGKGNGVSPVESENLQLIAFAKHVERRREDYDSAGKLYQVIDHPLDSLSMKAFTSPQGKTVGTPAPYFTKTTTTTYDTATGSQVTRQETESLDFDALNPGWRTTSINAYGPTGVLQGTRIASRVHQWQPDFARVAVLEETFPGQPKMARTFDTTGRLQTLSQMKPATTTPLWTLTYDYSRTNGSSPDSVVANGAGFNLSGQVGASYSYDMLGRMNGITYGGLTWSQVQDDLGYVTSQTDPNHLVKRFTWDDGGRLTSMTPPGEIATTYTYDADHLGVKITRSAQESHTRFNGFRDLIREFRKGQGNNLSCRLLGYDGAGRKVWESMWLPGEGSDYSWTMDVAEGSTGGSIQQCVQWRYNPKTDTEYCAQYQTILLPGWNGSSHFIYDAQGRVIKTVDPNGVTTLTAFGPGTLGERQTVIQGTGASQSTTQFHFDAFGRMAQVFDALGQQTTYSYDDANRILNVLQVDPAYTSRQQTRSWHYNDLGWLDSLTQPESGTTSYSAFDVNGKPWTTSYNGRVVNGAFDALGRMLSATAPDGSVSQAFTWDTAPSNGRGQLRSATANGVTREMDYAGVGGRLSTLTRRVDGFSFAQGFSYDTYGNLSSRIYPDGRVQTLTPDLATGLPVTSVFNGVSVMPVAVYDPTHWGLTQLTLANGVSSAFTYGADQTRLNTLKHKVPNKLDRTWTYAYDSQSRLLSAVGSDVQNTVGFRQDEERYTYDALGRLKTAMVRDPWDTTSGYANRGLFQRFDYDPFGNRFTGNTSTITNWPANQPPATATLSASLRAGLDKVVANVAFSRTDTAFLQNRLPASAGAVYDAQGNLTQVFPRVGASGESVNLAYDALGRVSSASFGPTATRKSESYLHDDEGLRIRVWDGSKYRYNLYNEARQLIAQYEKIGAGSLTWKKDIVYVGTKELAEASSDGKTYVTLNDHLGGPRFLYDGTTLSQQKFLPFGEGLADALSAAKFAKGFTNHEQTDASGLIYMQARFYAPWYGRFLSPDPARDQHFEETQSWNIYSYVQNNPVMSIDPDGMREWNLKNRALGALKMAGGAAQVGLAYTAGMASAMSGKGAPVVPILAAGVAAKGGDNFQAGAQQLMTGNHVDTASTQAIAGSTGMSIDKARMVDGAIDFAATVSLGAAQFKINANLDVVTGQGGASVSGAATNSFAPVEGETRVTRWMSQGEATKMKGTGNLQFGAEGRAYVTELGAPKPGGTGPVQVNFNVPTASLQQAGNKGWYQILETKRPPVTGIEVVK